MRNFCVKLFLISANSSGGIFLKDISIYSSASHFVRRSSGTVSPIYVEGLMRSI